MHRGSWLKGPEGCSQALSLEQASFTLGAFPWVLHPQPRALEVLYSPPTPENLPSLRLLQSPLGKPSLQLSLFEAGSHSFPTN